MAPSGRIQCYRQDREGSPYKTNTMPNTYQVFQIDAFTTTKFAGNPASVVLDADGLTDTQMQQIAREFNNSETAFVLSPTAGDHDFHVRFFTPTAEVPICGHATISTFYTLAITRGLDSCTLTQRTGAGILPVEIVKLDGGDYEIIMTQGKIQIGEILDSEHRQKLLTAFKLSEENLNPKCPPQVVTTGNSKLIFGLKDVSRIHALRPNLEALNQLSQKIGTPGYFPFAFLSANPKQATPNEIITECRMFAPAIGINEDPVTGNGNGPLGAYLTHHGLIETSSDSAIFSSRQGTAIGRPGTVKVSVYLQNHQPTKITVSGRAVVAFETKLCC